MKIFSNVSIAALAVTFALGIGGPVAAIAAGPAAVNLGAAGNFTILAKSGISTTGTTTIVGDIGVSPAAATAITGFGLSLSAGGPFSTSPLVVGKIYAPDYANPAPANLTSAVLDMQSAYTDAAGRAPTATELGAGNIGGLTLAPGIYKWSTGVSIPTDIILSGGANDVWIFQIAQKLDVSSGAKVVLAGGAQASNVFWAVAGQTTLGTTGVFNGTILDQTAIVMNTGAELHGRALAQTAVTLDSNLVNVPATAAAASAPMTTVCTGTDHSCPCATGNYCLFMGAMCLSPASACPTQTPSPTTTMPVATNPTPTGNAALQQELDTLIAELHALQAQAAQQGTFGVSVTGQGRDLYQTLAVNLGKGSSGSDVAILQRLLIAQNKGPAAQALTTVGATGIFGERTRAALAEFQAGVGISPASGYFGPVTRSYVIAHY
jgi:hypothetical protein